MSLLQQLATALSNGSVEVIDLTHTLEERIQIIPLPEPNHQQWPFRMEEISRFDERGPDWYWNNFSCGEHTGTHFDAPIHWISGRNYEDGSVDKIPVKKFIAPACVIDLTDRVHADYLTTIDDIERWEEQYGRIPAGSWVLLRTGWAAHQYTDKFLGVREDGGHWPGNTPEVTKFLAKERDVIGVGTEPVGTDSGQSSTFAEPLPCHYNMHGNNKFGLSSLNNLHLLPPTGSMLITPPLKIKEGSGSPCRVLALVER
jgi:kynurenine formamidase